jgi:hypothetical protein
VECKFEGGQIVSHQVFPDVFSVKPERSHAEIENRKILQIRQDVVFLETNQGTFRRPKAIAWREKGAIFVL